MAKKYFIPKVGPRSRARPTLTRIRRGNRIPLPSGFGKVGRRVFFKLLAREKVSVSFVPTGSLKEGRYQSTRIAFLLASGIKRKGA